MPVFKIEKDNLKSIKEKPIRLEREIQDLTEKNLETVFGYKFVCSEFTINNSRIDT